MTKKKRQRGPVAERVAIEGDWREAVAKAVRIQRPETGWPDPDNRGESRGRKPSKRAKKS